MARKRTGGTTHATDPARIDHSAPSGNPKIHFSCISVKLSPPIIEVDGWGARRYSPGIPPMNADIFRLLFFPLLCFDSASGAIALLDERPAPLHDWAFEYGYAYITHDTVDKLFLAQNSVAHGPAGGHMHLFTAAYRLGEPDWQFDDHQFKPLLELPLTLGIVEENSRSPFPNYAASFQVRWRDFPWNEWVSTTLSMGVGLAYSEKIFLMDRQTHPGRYRSRVKINWPTELSLALPQFPQHQLTTFIWHQSGGHIFDRGGINDFGFGYRHGW